MIERFPVLLACAGLLLAACTSSTPDPSAAPGTPGASPSSSASAPTDGATPSTDPSYTPLKSPVTPTASQPPADLAQPTEPPRAGTYTYRQEGEAALGPFTLSPDPEGTLTINPPNGVRQKQLRRYADSPEQTLEQVLLYRTGGVFLRSYESRVATNSVSCELEEPLLVVDLPLKVGKTWTDKGTCGSLSMRLQGRVAAFETRTVGGVEVDTFVLKITLQASGGGLEQTAVQSLWVSPEHRLIVRAVEQSNGTARGQEFSSHRTDELVSLQPS